MIHSAAKWAVSRPGTNLLLKHLKTSVIFEFRLVGVFFECIVLSVVPTLADRDGSQFDSAGISS